MIERVVGEVDGTHLDHRVVVDEVVDPASSPSGTPVTILPRLRSLAAPVIAPASTRSTTESVNISVWTPRSRLSVRNSAVAAGMAPMPSWSVAPSGMSSATCSPIWRSTVTDLTDRPLVGRHVDLDREVDLGDVDEAVAERPRHRPVELDDDRSRGPDGGVHRLDRRAEGAEAVGVRRRRVDEDRVEREGPASRRGAGRRTGRPARSRRDPR